MSDISFNGLTSDLRKTLLTQTQINASIRLHPKTKGFVGNLPAEWITPITKNQRNTVIPKIEQEFSSVVLQCKNNFTTRKAAKTLKKILTENKIIAPKSKVKIQYLGSGDFSDTYKFDVDKKNYVIKIFKDNSVKAENSFGNMFEQNNALYINAKNNSDWAKFYFGNISDKYMVTKYVSHSDPKPSEKIDLAQKGVEYIDYQVSNFINYTNIDYGGIKALEGFPLNDKIAIKTIAKLKRLSLEKQLEEIQNIENNRKNYIEYKHKKIGVDYFIKHNPTKKHVPEHMNFFEELLYYLKEYL